MKKYLVKDTNVFPPYLCELKKILPLLFSHEFICGNVITILIAHLKTMFKGKRLQFRPFSQRFAIKSLNLNSEWIRLLNVLSFCICSCVQLISAGDLLTDNETWNLSPFYFKRLSLTILRGKTACSKQKPFYFYDKVRFHMMGKSSK